MIRNKLFDPGADYMARPTVPFLLAVLLRAGGILAGLLALACGQAFATAPAGIQKIKYVVLIVQENRTPDNLFHGLPNADIATTGLDSKGQIVPLTQIPLAGGYDISHRHAAFVAMFDNGKMDGADKVPNGCNRKKMVCPPHPQFVYVNPADVAPYFQLAERFTFADRMFQTNQGPSFPAHQFLISGTSAPTASSDLFAAENPHLAPHATSFAGCKAPPGTYVAMIDPSGKESSNQFPCFEHPTLTDLLDSHKIDWRYYTPGANSIWNGPNAIQHIRLGPDWAGHVVLQQTRVLTDIAKATLAPVSWIIPNGYASDHPAYNNGTGPSWVASIVNAIGNSTYWAETAVIIVWDDWGGFYDHVAPRIYDSYEYGFRIPMIVVSPYAKLGYVSHEIHDFGSILKFIEEVYNLPSLGYADARADDLSDCFDFSQTPTPFQTIPARFNAAYFLNDKRPAIPPDTD
jgi:phospholipase C